LTESELKIPLVCRLYGNHFEEAKELLAEFTAKNPNFNIVVAEDMEDGAKKSCLNRNRIIFKN
jgi:succinyl-CoA synthetase beta subunit